MATAPLFRSRMFRECWEFRGFILASVRRDFVSRYLGTKLGFFWALAQPLAMILIYSVVLATVMKPVLPGHSSAFAYSIYLCSGIIVWQLFGDLLNRSVGIFVNNAGLLKKANLPKLALPLVVALSALSNFAVLLAIFFGFLLVVGSFPGIAVVALVPLAVLVVGFALGLGIFLGTINVFYRDVGQVVAMSLQFWFWLTPIVYPGRSLPDGVAAAIAWNPLSAIVAFSQVMFVEHRLLPWSTLTYSTLVTVALLLLGFVAFRRLGAEIADEL